MKRVPYAPLVTGKSVELVDPTSVAEPSPPKAMAEHRSCLEPPRYVEWRKRSISGSSFA